MSSLDWSNGWTRHRGGESRIDLESLTISAGPLEARFEIEDEKRRRLLGGLSSIDVTLERISEIEAFQDADRLARPWVHCDGDA